MTVLEMIVTGIALFSVTTIFGLGIFYAIDLHDKIRRID
mgnify:CR=1 FL=1|tara:strand:- start:457 stop:573 length:117 start_codon:yes stop_codon:yes gene_type:complete